MLDIMPEIAATSFSELNAELKKRLAEYQAAGASRMIIGYVPSSDDPTGETVEFIKSWS